MYLSPTSISKYYSDRRDFYLTYMVEPRPPRAPQTQPMSIGSAFDAYVKNYLVERLYGSNSKESDQFELAALLSTQVEAPHLSWATEHGRIVFDKYRASGALSDLMIELELASSPPRFEFTVKGVISSTNVEGITLLGKPDLYFETADGCSVIYDWKVNGYCAKRSKSPARGYGKCRTEAGICKMHRDYIGVVRSGIAVNVGMPFEDVSAIWASQLSIYSWLMGASVGSNTIIGIEQITGGGGRPLRFASHRGIVSAVFQHDLLLRIERVWACLQREIPVFDDVSALESEAICEQLDLIAHAFTDDKNDSDSWFSESHR